MTQQAPIALILFSNDLDNFLPMVEQERKVIEEALEHLNDSNRLKVIARSSVSIEEVFRLFNRYQKRIVLFHFAGHANGGGLQFNKNFTDKEMGKAVGLVDLFAREAQKGILQFVFLNGCRTAPQVENLRQAGVPSIMATHWEIPDQKALELAKQLYRSLANADQANPFATAPTNLQTAFETAIAFLKTKYDQQISISRAAGRAHVQITGQQEPWELFSTQEDWTLPFNIANEHKAFNELLIKKLMAAIQPYSRPAQKLMARVKNIEAWETTNTYGKAAKEIMVYSFVGVLGIQLRKLMAIGENTPSPNTQKNYLSNCFLTGKRALQLLCFAMVSRFWDHQKIGNYNLSTEQSTVLQRFFEDSFEQDLKGYLQLLTVLYQLFEQYDLEFPMTELKDFKPQLAAQSDFINACEKLQDLERLVDKSQFQLTDCYTAERQLTTMLISLNFLANYRMVSIKSIAYDEMRNRPPRYLHTYAALGVDSKSKTNIEKVNYAEETINTDAILLFKDRYKKNINLFPFIIDYNALTFEGGAKVCFYSCRHIEDGSLCYRFLEDNKKEYIAYQNTLNPRLSAKEINLLMSREENRKNLKLDAVYLQFEEAKQDILPMMEEEDLDFFGEEEDDF